MLRYTMCPLEAFFCQVHAFRLLRLVVDRTQNLLLSEGKSFNQNLIPKSTFSHSTSPPQARDAHSRYS